MMPEIDFDMAPFRLSGTVYGTLLNHKPALDELGDAVNQPPYKAAPKAPILYVKPRNTLNSHGETVVIPNHAPGLQAGAALGLVIARVACAVSAEEALEYLAGYTVVVDFSVPHESFYRPSIRFKALDGSCVIGPVVKDRSQIINPDALDVRVTVDGERVQTTSTANMIRNAAKLIADVTEFMTLQPGDVLLLGVADGAPLVQAGQQIKVEIDGIGALESKLVKEEA